MDQIVFPLSDSGATFLKPEWIALAGVIISGVIAYLIANKKDRAEQRAFEARMALEQESLKRETRRLKTQRQFEIAEKYAELSSANQAMADQFLNEIAKQTAIGFLYFESGAFKAKIWVRDDANLLIGRDPFCDVVVSDAYVSRQHMFIHSVDGNAYAVPVYPTNETIVNGEAVEGRTRLSHQSDILIGKTTLHYFSLHEAGEA